MTHTYNVTGMTCEGCSAKVSHLLKQLPDVNNVAIDLAAGEATVSMDKHVPTPALQDALKDYPKYQLTDKQHQHQPKEIKNIFGEQPQEEQRSWLETYKPILIIAAYITLVAAIAASTQSEFSGMTFMRIFMSGFFLTFSFFKMLDLKGFAESYAMYDVVAMKFKGWGYTYAFIELALGIAFALNFEPVITNSVTAVVMSVSLIGVLQSILNKKKIQCACLGAVFNLPMSTVTIIEDGLMILMSVAMLAMYI
jgi:copper chaperone CopZ/small basic protein